MIINNPEKYILLGFEVNRGRRYKYDAILENKHTKQKKRVPFGGKKADGTPYEHYRDQIGRYREYDHGDENRRRLYRIRHRGEEQRKFSSGYFAYTFLWIVMVIWS